MRARIAGSPRSYGSALAFLILIGLFAWPWSATVYVPALLEARDLERVYTPRASRIKSVHVRHGERVVEGALLVEGVAHGGEIGAHYQIIGTLLLLLLVGEGLLWF